MVTKKVIRELAQSLNEGYTIMNDIRGNRYGSFMHDMLMSSIKCSENNYMSLIEKNFDTSIKNEVNDYCQKKGFPLFSIHHFDKLLSTYIEKRYKLNRIFFDMDGVLFKFDNILQSVDPLYEEGYFRNLPIQKATIKAINEILENSPEQVYILSHYVDSPYAKKEKLESLKQYCPGLIPENIILVPYNENKTDYVPINVKENDVLIDDYNKNLIKWKEAGGFPIKFVNQINDVRGTFQGQRLEYDDPMIIESLINIVNNLEQLKSIDDATSLYMKENMEQLERWENTFIE